LIESKLREKKEKNYRISIFLLTWSVKSKWINKKWKEYFKKAIQSRFFVQFNFPKESNRIKIELFDSISLFRYKRSMKFGKKENFVFYKWIVYIEMN